MKTTKNFKLKFLITEPDGTKKVELCNRACITYNDEQDFLVKFSDAYTQLVLRFKNEQHDRKVDLISMIAIGETNE